jgi:signal transduction histidine kinase
MFTLYFMEKKYKLFSYFLHPSFRKSLIRNRKATILIFAHYFTIFALFSLLILSETIEKVALIPAFCAVPIIIGALFYFKKKGGITVSGNILSIVWFATLLPVLLNTGGINSCFMPWLYSIILVMVLVENYIWATIWFSIASVTCIAIYVAGRFYPSINVNICNETDAVISYFLVGLFMFLNMIIFERNQVFVIRILRRKNEELKTQKKVLAKNMAELKKVQQQLTESNKELQIFAFAASHDLKEPLRMVTMYTQMIRRSLKDVLTEQTTEYVNYVTDGVKRMQSLLDNLLAYSLLGQNKQDNIAINLNEKLKKVILNLTVAIQESDANVVCCDLPTITASPTEMIQLFQNIIANALKFRKSDVKPFIEVCAKEEENAFIFTISDNGIGIKKEDQERVFQIFTRLNSREHFEGTGIGLATCKKILTKMNGKIWVTSTEGVGTTFHFSIPKTCLSELIEPTDNKKTIEDVALSH